MAQQVQFLIKVFIFCCIVSCSSKNEKPIKMQLVTNKDTNLQIVNGIVYYQTKLFSGKIVSFFDSSKDTLSIKNFILGKEDGVWKEFYHNQNIKLIRNFKDGKKIDSLIGFWENKNKMLAYYFINDEYEGTGKEWNRDGRLIREMNYKNGHEEGSQRMFYDNGKVRSNYVIINGKRFGLLGTKNCINVSDSIFKK